MRNINSVSYGTVPGIVTDERPEIGHDRPELLVIRGRNTNFTTDFLEFSDDCLKPLLIEC